MRLLFFCGLLAIVGSDIVWTAAHFDLADRTGGLSGTDSVSGTASI